jgi:UTP--glucose-1-phosphate uridylyltransferase
MSAAPTTGYDSHFRDLKLHDAKEALHTELDKLITTAASRETPERLRVQFAGFERLFARFLLEKGPSVDWEKISPPPEETIKPYGSLVGEYPKETMRDLLNSLVVLKLNGGLGTSMGCTGPKSLISVRNELTFLDLTVQQIDHLNTSYDANVPLVLMNSFNTDEDTSKILRKYGKMKVKIHTFNQSRYPRINRESLLPLAKNALADDLESWYPPGHGDVYESFYNSGLLQKLIDQGKRYVFISNIDNLGATVDLNILNYLMNAKARCDFVMEVTDKTRADVKGGTLVMYEDTLRLLEIAQVPKERVDEFKSVSKFKIFNTNNLWVSMPAMKEVVEERKLHLEIIVNPKTLDNGINIIQLETAVGAGIKCFEGSIGVNVPRSRFLPVKTTSDLLVIMSNLYSLQTGNLVMNPLRSFQSVPLVKLGTSFNKVKDFLNRFASIPDLLDLDHLTVSGDVTFGRGVALKGTVIIIANQSERIDIPPGAILENKIVSGNLRILDH